MRNKHLRLVAVNNNKNQEKSISANYSEIIKDFFDCIFISENRKIYLIKETLTRLYKDYEETTGIIDEPYFIRAEKKVRRIIREKKVDHYYKLLKKFRQERFYY